MKRLFEELSPQSALVVVTHKPHLLTHVNRVIVIDQGHIVLDGPRDEVLARLRGGAAAPASAPSGPTAQPTPREGKAA